MTAPEQPFIPDNLLKDKVIIITGASQGIGLVSAHGFACAGAKVVLTARRGDIVEKIAKDIAVQGGTALGFECDVTNEESVKRMVGRTVEKFGRLDGAFNNAGIDTKPALLADYPFEDWKRVHDVKINGTFLSMKYEIPAMIASGGGNIVNNGSCTSDHSPAMYPFASSSQSAIPGMTRNAAVAYAKQNIRVNMISTGLILTPERVGASYAGMEEVMNKYAPIGRPGKAEEIAQIAAWLLSDYATYMVGSVVTVDGGHNAGEAP
jgi:NAD(P)-dependent dehydrogenase (short-subunit alcohol dehydrogenase family)